MHISNLASNYFVVLSLINSLNTLQNGSLFHSTSRPRFQKLSALWSKKLDLYWSIEDIMKTNKSILLHPRRCYVIQIKKNAKK